MKTINHETVISQSIPQTLGTIFDTRTPFHGECARKSRGIWIAFFFLALLVGCGSKATAGPDDPANAPHVAVVKVGRRTLANTLEIASELCEGFGLHSKAERGLGHAR